MLRLSLIAVLMLALAGCGGNKEGETDTGKAGTEKMEAGEMTQTADTTASVITNEMLDKAVTTPSGLKYIDLKVGDGASPKKGQTVVVQYTGWLENGKKFDSSRDRGIPFEFVIGTGNVIKGWDEGVMGMKVGGVRKLIIPPDLAYGSRGVGGGLIPPNSTLIFDVELVDIK